jgi:hypothetical protein
MLDERIADIRKAFGPAIGTELRGYSTAELLLDDGTWDAWPDLPIRLELSSGYLIAISWSKFDDLWIATDDSLPFSVEGSTVRWVHNALDKLNDAVGAPIRSVMLGRGEMSAKGKEVEIWTRLLIETDEGWLEIFNALDENGYDLHLEKPDGTFVSCI